MISFGVRIEKEVLEQAKKKAGLVPLSAIIRRLIEMWLRDEIKVDISKKEGELPGHKGC